MDERNEKICAIIGYRFKNLALLERAFSHSSAHPTNASASNERLEFLGDAVLKLYTSEYLFTNFKQARPKELTSYRKRLESTEALAAVVEKYDLHSFLKTAKNQVTSEKMKADLFEAMIGAIYLDGGIEQAKRVAEKFLSERFDLVTEDNDYVSQLKEWGEHSGVTIEYVPVSEKGADNEKSFEFELLLDGKSVAKATASNTTKAEMLCAGIALKKIKG